jgi:glyoxylase-like metal-dependent hydrolase (beta-lactamase superfamily II)
VTGARPPGGSRHLSRSLTAGLFLLAVLVAIAFITLRVARASFEPPAEVAPGVMAVRCAGGVWIYGARVGDEVVLFDAGIDREARPIRALVGALGRRLSDVTDVFLTHGHGDHAAALAAMPGARIHVGAGDVELVEGRRYPGLAARLTAVLLSVAPAPVFDGIDRARDIPVRDGEVVRALPAPGHTPGTVAYLFRGVLFGGDALGLADGRLGAGPPLFDGDPEESRRSARALAREVAARPPAVICTGHDGCSTPGSGARLLATLLAVGPRAPGD